MKQLNDGNAMPDQGFGAMIYSDREAYKSVSFALETGYRLIDTAEAYNNESAVGRAVNDISIPREEIFLTTKLWPGSGMSRRTVRKHMEESLKRLHQDYVDLYLVHEPYGDIVSIWEGMIDLKEAGLAKSIGVSNFKKSDLEEIIRATGVKPVVNQIESHPWYNENALVKATQDMGIQPESWASLAEGRNHIFTNPVLKEIAEAHGRSVAQVILRWELDRGLIPLSKSSNPSRMKENFIIGGFTLTSEEIDRINRLDTGVSLWPGY